MHKHFDVDKVLRLADRARWIKPIAYVYENNGLKAPSADCVNLTRDENGEPQPSCLIGHILWLGVEEEDRKFIPEQGSYLESTGNLEEKAGYTFTPAARAVMGIMQSLQDGGLDWHRSIANARMALRMSGDLAVDNSL